MYMDRHGYISTMLLSKNNKFQMHVYPTGVVSAVYQIPLVLPGTCQDCTLPTAAEAGEALWLALANEVGADASG